MGMFSFITSDTKRSIPNVYSGRDTFPVYMFTKEGEVFFEPEYEGYGRFGSKGFYELVAELNGLENTTEAIHLLYRTLITDGETTYEFHKDFENWEQPLTDDGKTANQLVREGWKQVHPNGYGDYGKAAANGIKIPKIVEKLPENGDVWDEVWDSLPYPESCPFQGYFYPEFDEEE